MAAFAKVGRSRSYLRELPASDGCVFIPPEKNLGGGALKRAPTLRPSILLLPCSPSA